MKQSELQNNGQPVFDFPIPAKINLLILLLASTANAALLWVASHSSGLCLRLLAAVAFSFTANTMFSLMHEAVHGILHPVYWVNQWGGRIAAAFFPTSFGLQRGFHLTHHRFNRTVVERFDYFQPGDIKWLKIAQWYSILTGIYWIMSVIGVLSYLLIPAGLRVKFLRSDESQVARQTASQIYFKVFDNLPPITTRLEILFSFAVQAGLFIVLDLNWQGWLLCYLLFGLHWSSLQYADHAFSPLDLTEGAWNLRVNPIARAFFLNYHYHLVHHRHPAVSWLYLKKLIRPEDPFPYFIKMYLSMWRGPRALPDELE